MCKRCARSSQCENIMAMQNFLDHSEGVSKVTPQICRSSGVGGQKILHHHKSMQVWEPSSLAWCMLYMAGLSGQDLCIWQWFVLLGLFLLCFAFWVHREDGCTGENRSWMHKLFIGKVQMVPLSCNRLFHGDGLSLLLPGPSRWSQAAVQGLPSQTS